MKKTIKKILLLIAGCYIFGFLACFVAAQILRKNYTVLPIFDTAYLINRALLFFTAIFPAVHISAFLIGFSWFFKDFFDDAEIKKSALRAKIIRSVFVTIIISIGFAIISAELVSPLLRENRRTMENNTADYDDSMNSARAFINSKQYNDALPYIQQALALYPASPEALSFKRSIEDAFSQYKKPNDLPQTSIKTEKTDALSFIELLTKARDSYTAESYIDAHYYATLALQNADTHSVQEARTIAAAAWNKLSETASGVLDESATLFSNKKKGYYAILQGDYLAAYYLFFELNTRYAGDPDIKRYLAIAKKSLLSQFFFIDETYDLRSFENMSHIYFSVKRPDGNTDIVYISGLSSVKNAAGLVQYARGMQVNRFDINKKFDFSLSVEYAKFFSEPAATFGTEFADYFKNISAPDSLVPVLQLVSVDRKTQGIVKSPVYVPEQQERDLFNTYVLYLPYSDFQLIAQASSGASNMPLQSLWQFASKAQNYGYSFEVFYQTLCSRICYPLLLLVITMIAATFAWRFRLSTSQIVKFRWLLVLPFSTAIFYGVIEFAHSIFKLFIYSLIGLLKWYALPAAALFLLIVFVLTAIYFAAHTHE